MSSQLATNAVLPTERSPAPSASRQDCRQAPHPATYFQLADAPNRLAAAVLLVLAAPVMAILMGLVRLSSPGPALYCQRRTGRNGRDFWMYKIRSMRVDAERGCGAVWAKESDPRTTCLGRRMRAMHLDELPQLWNVVKGDMALIGPRPERPEFVVKLVRRVPGYLTRQLVRPGITGLAQINLPADANYGDVRRKLVLDQEYIEQGSFGLDLRIVACTLLRLVGCQSNFARQALGVNRQLLTAKEEGLPQPDDSFSSSSIIFLDVASLAALR